MQIRILHRRGFIVLCPIITASTTGALLCSRTRSRILHRLRPGPNRLIEMPVHTRTTSSQTTFAATSDHSRSEPNEKPISSRMNKKPKIEPDTIYEPSPTEPMTPPRNVKSTDTILYHTPTVQESITHTPKTNSSKKKSKPITEPGSLQPPKGWEEIYKLVEELRADRTAPVDSDGCEALAQRDRNPQIFRFQVLIALMLSSQTKDAVVGETMKHLQKFGLDVQTIHATSIETLNERISKVGFHNNKSKFIKQTAEILIRDYQGDIPPTVEELMNLPGVGPKMAYIVEQVAWNKCTGIGVDTHMHRMFNDLGWVRGTSSPEKTREELQGWLPRDKWDGINCLFVGFGQESQQQKHKIIRKALVCSKPVEALKLLKKVGVNIDKEAKRYGLEEDVKKVMKPT